MVEDKSSWITFSDPSNAKFPCQRELYKAWNL